MKYEAKNFDELLGTEGFSDNALKTHFALYQGYVANTNKVLELLEKKKTEGKTGDYEFAELKRRFGWEFNGMRLHEYYFGGMIKEGKEINRESALYKKIAEDFGSFEDWQKDFKATASARGIGWTILYYDSKADKLINVWINEHDTAHLAGCKVILNIDVFEHAFMIDYNKDKKSYIDAFMKVVNWQEIEKRFEE